MENDITMPTKYDKRKTNSICRYYSSTHLVVSDYTFLLEPAISSGALKNCKVTAQERHANISIPSLVQCQPAGNRPSV
jgi:hypothetical protein